MHLITPVCVHDPHAARRRLLLLVAVKGPACVRQVQHRVQDTLGLQNRSQVARIARDKLVGPRGRELRVQVLQLAPLLGHGHVKGPVEWRTVGQLFGTRPGRMGHR